MKKEKQDELIYLSLDSIIPYENNPRDNDASVPFVAKSIEDFGYKSKIEVNEQHVVLVGHTRLKALKLLQMQGKLGKGELVDVTEDHIPVIVVHNLKTKAKQMEYRLSDNKTTEKSGWIFPMVDSEIAEIKKLDPVCDMEVYGFEFDNYESKPAPPEQDIEVMDVDVPIHDEIGQSHIICVYIDDADAAKELLTRLKNEGFDCKMD